LSQVELSNLLVWNQGNGPVLGKIENIEFEGFGGLGAEDLNVNGPGWKVSRCDVVEQVLGGEVGVGSHNDCSFGDSEVLDALVGLSKELDVVPRPVGTNKTVGVSRPSIHVPESIWSS